MTVDELITELQKQSAAGNGALEVVWNAEYRGSYEDYYVGGMRVRPTEERNASRNVLELLI